MKFKFVLKGLSPLLVHADDVQLSDNVKAWQMDPVNKPLSVPGDDRSPAWTWQTYCYTDGEHLTVPADCLTACLIQAAAQVSLKGKKTFKEAVACGLFLKDDHMPILIKGKPISARGVTALTDLTFAEQAEGAKKLGFDLYVKRAKVGQAKHVRVRPRFSDWELKGEIHILAKEITEVHLRQIFDIAAFYKGLCDWRPGSPKKPGRFGRFAVEMEKIK